MRTHRRQLLVMALTGVATLTVGPARAAEKAIYQGRNGVAIDGTDPVAYFSQGRPVAGEASITHEWNGAVWRFASAANRDRFAAEPEAYAPQYGGYCAWAVSQGYTASTDPDAWKIVDGKLYLNYNRRIQRRWEGDIAGNISAADGNWPSVLN